MNSGRGCIFSNKTRPWREQRIIELQGEVFRRLQRRRERDAAQSFGEAAKEGRVAAVAGVEATEKGGIGYEAAPELAHAGGTRERGWRSGKAEEDLGDWITKNDRTAPPPLDGCAEPPSPAGRASSPVLLAVTQQLGLGDLGHGRPAHARGHAVGPAGRGGELLLFNLGEAALLSVLAATGGQGLGRRRGCRTAAARRGATGVRERERGRRKMRPVDFVAIIPKISSWQEIIILLRGHRLRAAVASGGRHSPAGTPAAG
ncbi:hypothetical protein PR202_ga07065 [Eleusine coracana subsp. coracana]|uniref:Uncharacterized protein n=1 Tax=Eleusine coracana subsp. coracana TaxID=191504 RepID=A0AAV5BYP1_ELECO|nr:hypothetical protein PR202_ga07065 [Eleusine coracana subsp. coracana]